MTVLPVDRYSAMPSSPRFHDDPSDRDSYSRRLKLAALPTAVPLARLFVVDQLGQLGLSGLGDDCALCVSELVTNAITATGSTELPKCYAELRLLCQATLVLRFRRTGKRLFVELWDRSEDPPVVRELADLDEEEEGGRGLHLVAALTSDWNWYPSRSGGKVVWCSWDLPI